MSLIFCNNTKTEYDYTIDYPEYKQEQYDDIWCFMYFSQKQNLIAEKGFNHQKHFYCDKNGKNWQVTEAFSIKRYILKNVTDDYLKRFSDGKYLGIGKYVGNKTTKPVENTQ